MKNQEDTTSPKLEPGAKMPLFVAQAIAKADGLTFTYTVIERRRGRQSIVRIEEVWHSFLADPVNA
jgi:hypothetical protein